MAEIYDFISGKSLTKLVNHNYKQNDEVIEKVGKYVGVLTKPQSNLLRKTISDLEFKRHQIELLMAEYEELRSRYEQMEMNAVEFLQASKNGVDYTPDEWELYVDKDGHCWVVQKELRLELEKQNGLT